MLTFVLLSLISSIECTSGAVQEITSKDNIETIFTVAPNKNGQCVPHGSWEEYYPNDKPRLHATYKLGISVGSWTQWFQNGQMSKRGKFDNNGLETGLWIIWYRNGKMWQSGSYEAGKQTGTWWVWRKDGTAESVTEWLNGKLHGKLINFHPNLQKSVEGMLKHGKQVDVWKWWDKQGNLTKTKDFQ